MSKNAQAEKYSVSVSLDVLSQRAQAAEDVVPSPPVSAVYPPPAEAFTNLANHAPSNGQIYSNRDHNAWTQAEGGSPPEGTHVYRQEAEPVSPTRTDAEGKSLAELKMSFTMRMNEAIRLQRERMRVLLSDVDSKIVSLKKEHGLREPSVGLDLSSGSEQDAAVGTPSSCRPQIEVQPPTPKVDTDNKENDSSAESHASSEDTIITPVRRDRNAPPPSSGFSPMSPSTPFSPGMMERDLQVEILKCQLPMKFTI